MISLVTDDYCKSNQIGYYVIMLSMMLLCAAMMAASWAYASMWKSGEIGPGRMSTKYKIILVLYLAVALFIIYAGGLIVFLIYALFAAVGAAIGWMTTKEGSYEDTDGIMNDDGKSLFRVPVRLQSQVSASDTIENYELKSADEHNGNNDNILNDNESIESTANTDSDVIVDNDVKSEQEDAPETSPDDKQDELIDDNSKPVNDDTDSQNAESNENNEIKPVWTGSDDADSHAIIDFNENNDSNGKE